MKILAFWSASDFEEFFAPAFLGRSDFQVEIVSGDRTSTRSPHAAGPARVRQLRQRLEAGEFDLAVSGSVWSTRVPRHKSFWTQLAVAARYSTFKRSRLDTDLVPELMRGLRRKVPLAVLDLRDVHFVLPGDLPLLRASTLYFKRELFAWPRRSLLPLMTWNRERDMAGLEEKLRPLSYGLRPEAINQSGLPMAERDIDIFMSGLGNPVRGEISRRCQALSDRYKVVVAPAKVSRKEYFDYLRRSKLVVCTESFGCETWRQYDVSAAGAVPLINYPYVLHHDAMEPDVHAIFFSMAGRDFEKQAERALRSPSLLEEISRCTRDWTLEHKTRSRIADYVVRETLAAKA